MPLDRFFMHTQETYIARHEVAPHLAKHGVRWTRGGKVSVGDEHHGLRIADLAVEENPRTGEQDGIFIDPKTFYISGRFDAFESDRITLVVQAAFEDAFREVLKQRSIPQQSIEADFFEDVKLAIALLQNQVNAALAPIKAALSPPEAE